eukprot:gene7524-9635_t
MNNYRAFEDIELSGNSREYTLVVHRVPVTWEGYDKSLIVINGTSPGPILTVTLGDVLVVHLINMLEDDETTLHFHGLSMRNTPWMDGIVNVTQCPVGSSPRNQSITYRMVPQSPGTYWYHGHFHNQYPDGLYGALIVLHPSGVNEYQTNSNSSNSSNSSSMAASLSVNYTIDGTAQWTIALADYYAQETRFLMDSLLNGGSFGFDPVPDAFTVNGHFSESFTWENVSLLQPIRLRIINVAAFSAFRVSIDGLPLTLIEIDGYAVQPLDVPSASVRLFTAQRASVQLDWQRLAPSLRRPPQCQTFLRVDLQPDIYPQYDATATNGNLYGTVSQRPLSFSWVGRIVFTDGACAAQTPSNPPYPALSSDETLRFSTLHMRPDSTAADDYNQLDARLLRTDIAVPPPPTHNVSITTQFYVVDEARGIVRAYINDETFAAEAMATMSNALSSSSAMTPMLYRYMRR